MIKYDNLFYILNGGDTYKFNKKLIAILGIELCALTTYLIERALNREEKDELTEDGYFTLTDTDICLYSGLEAVRLSKIKKLGIEKSIFETKKVEGVEGIFYKPNLEKIFELMMSDLHQRDAQRRHGPDIVVDGSVRCIIHRGIGHIS